MSACSRDRNTGSSAGAALRITRSYLRFMRNINSARRNTTCQPIPTGMPVVTASPWPKNTLCTASPPAADRAAHRRPEYYRP